MSENYLTFSEKVRQIKAKYENESSFEVEKMVDLFELNQERIYDDDCMKRTSSFIENMNEIKERKQRKKL